MKKIIIPSILILTTLLTSCKESAEVSEVNDNTQELNQTLSDQGFAVLEKNCFSCHSPNVNSTENIASTMAEIKMAFITKFENEVDFSKAISDYVQHPSDENAVVKGAFKKYGTMPQMEFSEDELKAVGYFVFHSNIEKENWITDVYPKLKANYMANASTENKSYVEKGREYAMATKSVLGKNLMGKIKTVGTDEALSFCNVRAISLVDSMSNVQNVQIKRVSDKNRNPNNAANEMELAYIEGAKALLSRGYELKPQTQEIDGKVVGYYPILTNNMCMQCHGEPEKQILPSTMELLKKFYPNDKAAGYGEGELRGIWVVEMEK